MNSSLPPSVSILLLAAGSSQRLGRPKQLLPFKNTTLIRYLAGVAVASKAQGVIVVVGASSDSIRQSLQGLPVAFIENRLWQEGLSSSIRCGLEGLWGSDAVLLMLCDQPEVTTSLLDTMIDTFQSGNHPIVACEYSGTVGVPAIFPKQFFSELEGLSGDRGAKPLLNRHLKDIARIPFSGGVLDIDRPEDLDRLRS